MNNGPTSRVDDVLREAMLAHRAGRLAAAEAGYRRVLRQRPRDAKALHFLGLLHFHRGEKEAGIRCLSQSLESDPSNARAWNALGGMFIAVEQRSQAMQAYRRSTEVAPEVAEGWYNLAICLRNEGDVEGAVANLREAIGRDPDYFRAYDALAMLLYQLERLPEAAQLYSEWIAHDPSSEIARYMAAATSGQNVPQRAPDEYVRTLFDEAAPGFDARLEQLGYRAPQSVAGALAHHIQPTRLGSVLDAGCGTGLCAPTLRAHCQRLVGVDLSPNMIARAKERGCYDELVAAEIVAFMRAEPNAFDAVISADTLVYFGALEEPFSAARGALRRGGWLIFTLEALERSPEVKYRLQFHGRYAHDEAYVRASLLRAGFQLESLARETLRREGEQDVTGFVVVARSV